jgi:hypothetical protein
MRERVFPIGLFVVALASFGSLSCNGRTNQLTETQHLTLTTIEAGTTVTGFTQTTFEDSIDASEVVNLLDVSIASSTDEFSWLASVTGAAPSGQLVVSRSPMNDTESPVSLTVVDTGNVRPLFVDEHTVRLNWVTQIASTLSQSYPDGVTITITYTLQLD